MARLLVSGLARTDLRGIWNHIAVEKQNPDAADRLLDEIDRAVQQLVNQPEMGIRVNELAEGCRRLVVRERYLIYYRVAGRDVQVVRILHGARYVHPGFFSQSNPE